MHRNGVRILATFLVEGDRDDLGRLLETDSVGDFTIARHLARMSDAYGFDGWLLNVEAEFPCSQQHLVRQLPAFIRALKRYSGGDSLVVWYDALTRNNEVDFQNALTAENVDFALAADLFFTNYKWSRSKVQETKTCADLHGIAHPEVFFGIDVWAQNTNMPGPPRITYPKDGGGGTLTGVVGILRTPWRQCD